MSGAVHVSLTRNGGTLGIGVVGGYDSRNDSKSAIFVKTVRAP